jgi:hypothetical protein
VTYRIDDQEMAGVGVVVVTLTGTSDRDTITGMLRELDERAPRLIFIDESEFKPDLRPGDQGSR